MTWNKHSDKESGKFGCSGNMSYFKFHAVCSGKQTELFTIWKVVMKALVQF